MDTPKKIRQIKQHIRGMGVQPAVIDAVDMLCEIIEELIDAQVRMLDMQKEISVSTDTGKVPEADLPITKNKGSVEGSEADETTNKTKPVEDTKMSNDSKPDVDVDSSIESAVKAIKKEKKKKKETLENIFSDNKTGRYSGPIDS
jgi:hypothetical protein